MTRDDIVFISFYTRDYAKYANRLLAQLRRLGLRRHIEKVDSRGSWLLNVRWKPTFIQRMMETYKTATALVWLDADAQLHVEPDLFYGISTPFACRFLKNPGIEIHLGTFFMRNTKRTRGFVDRWVKAMKTAPMGLRCPEQEVLYNLMQEIRPQVMNLPEHYCHIPRESDKWAVISQTQASREIREPEKRARVLAGKETLTLHDWEEDIAWAKEVRKAQ